jgi:alkylmercury lyase
MTPGVETTGQALALRLCRDDDACAALCAQLVRLLANAQPVSPERLAATLGVSRAAVDATLRHVPNVEFDGRGQIIAAGLSLVPTPHQFRVEGKTLYTWCALDTLMYPLVLQQTAEVSSRCPFTGSSVHLTVTPEGIVALTPADALVSMVVPEAAAARCDVRAVFCQHVHFLAGSAAGAAWQAGHPGSKMLSVEEAFGVARLLAAHRYRLAPP